VQLDPGSPSAPTVKSGYTVPLSNTALPTQFFTVISTLTTPVRASFISSLHELRTGLGGGGAQSFNQLIQQLPPVLRDSSIAAEAAQGTQPNDVSSGIGGISRVTSAFARNDASLGGLVANENQVAGTLASQSAALSASLRELDATLAVAPPALSALDGALPPLKRFSDDLRPALQEAPPVLNGAADLLHDVDVISRPSQLPKLLGVVRPLVEALPTLTSRLEDLFPRVQEVASCINTQAIPALNTKLDDGALSTGRPVWQDLLHGLVGLAGNESYFDGNGPVPRLYGGIGPTVLSVLPTGNVLSSGTFLGSRPHWAGPSALPPLRPDVACTTQQLGQLQTPAAPALDIRATRRAPTAGLSAQQIERLIAPRHSRRVAP
jgi:ABC-type transporter Mla subunit MlaD